MLETADKAFGALIETGLLGVLLVIAMVALYLMYRHNQTLQARLSSELRGIIEQQSSELRAIIEQQVTATLQAANALRENAKAIEDNTRLVQEFMLRRENR